MNNEKTSKKYLYVFIGLFMTKNEEAEKYVPKRKLKRDIISNALSANYIDV